MSRKSLWNQAHVLLAILGILLIVSGIAVVAVNGARDRALDQRLNSLEQRYSLITQRLTTAREIHQQNRGAYASHWTIGLSELLSEAEVIMGENGQVAKELQQARVAQQAKDRKLAQTHADNAENLLSSPLAVVNKLLGPPEMSGQGLYDELARKAGLAQARMNGAAIRISEVHTELNAKLAESWNSTHGLSLATAYAKLAEADATLAAAHHTLTTPVDDLIDKPLVYDQAEQAIDQCDETIDLALADEQNARNAWTTIESARIKIIEAQTYILASNYRQAEALSVLARVESTLKLAEEAFWREEFVSARTQADQADYQADIAWQVAATPTPTPSPTPTPPPTLTPEPRPVIIVDDDDDGSAWDWGSGDGSSWGSDDNDSSWDSSSDDDSSWDSGDDSDWGGSSDDSWGSDDDWGSDDSWSSDDSWGSDDGWSSDDGW